jgi:hypothetical protein
VTRADGSSIGRAMVRLAGVAAGLGRYLQER